MPLVVTTLGGDLYALGDPVSRALKRSVLRHARAVTVMNADMRERAIALGANPDTTYVMPMGAQVAQFADAAAGRVSRVPEGPVRLLAVGRLVEKKGFSVLLEALAEIDPDAWHLTIVGDGPERQALEAAAANLPVDFVGQLTREALTRADAEAEVAVFPSVRAASGDQDGLPVALLEAMASGCAVIVSDLPGLDEAVVPGVSGISVPSGDVAALRAALGTVVGDPALRVALGAGAAVRAQSFDVAAVADGYAQVLEAASRSSSRRSTTEALVLHLGLKLLGAPPRLVVAVPRDGCGEPGGEVLVERLPAELLAQLARVDRVAHVVTGAVVHVVVGVRGLTHLRKDHLDHGLVVHLAVGADQVRLAATPLSMMVHTARL